MRFGFIGAGQMAARWFDAAAVVRILAAAVPGRSSERRATAASPGTDQEAE